MQVFFFLAQESMQMCTAENKLWLIAIQIGHVN